MMIMMSKMNCLAPTMCSCQSMSNLKKEKKKALETLDKKERKKNTLMKNLEENKSFVDFQKLDLTKKYEDIQKRYSDFLEKFNADH